MTGIINTFPPVTELPPGSASGPANLPPVTYQYAVLGLAQTWTAPQTFAFGMFQLAGSISGVTALQPQAVAGGILSIPNGPDTLVGLASTGTFTNKTWNGATITVAFGGTGATSLTAHGILLGEGVGAVVATAAMTNGQLLVGQTGTDPLPTALSGDATLSAAGALTINAIVDAKVAAGAAIASSKLSYTNPSTGGVARTILAKLQDFISVIDFGADPTGVADSTAAIQAAVNVGGFIFCPAGTYLILGTVTITKPCTLFGAGDSGGNANGIGLTNWATANDGLHNSNDFLRINSNAVTVEGIAFNGLGTRATASNLGRAIVVGADEVNVSDGAITNGSTDFVSASTTYTAADVGKSIYIVGAGVTGAPLFTTIASLGALHHVNLALAASTTVAAATARWANMYTGTTIRGCSAISHAIGIHFMNAQKWLVDDCYLNNFYALQAECRVNPDGGDNRISATWFFADTTAGRCVFWGSGGGLWIEHSKFLQAWRHIEQNWVLGQSGEFGLHGTSLEGYGAGGSCFFSCAATFNGYNIVGNRWGGGASPPITFDNAGSVPAQEIVVSGNAFGAISTGNIVDFGKVNYAYIGDNLFRGSGTTTGINIRANAAFVRVGKNQFVGVTTPIANVGTTCVTSGAFSAARGTTQSVAASAFAKVQWNSVDFDDDATYDGVTNFRHTAPVIGKYKYSAMVTLDTLTGGRFMQIQLVKNGVTVIRNVNFTSGATTQQSAVVETAVSMAVGDTMEVQVFHNDTVSRNVGATNTGQFSGALIS